MNVLRMVVMLGSAARIYFLFLLALFSLDVKPCLPDPLLCGIRHMLISCPVSPFSIGMAWHPLHELHMCRPEILRQLRGPPPVPQLR